MFQVRSPQSRKSNLPSRNRIARLRALSEGSTGRSAGALGTERDWRGRSVAAAKTRPRGQQRSREAAPEREGIAGLERSPLAFRCLAIGDPQGVVGLGAVGEIEPRIAVLGQPPIPEMLDLDQLRQPATPPKWSMCQWVVIRWSRWSQPARSLRTWTIRLGSRSSSPASRNRSGSILARE